jgi:hypothetical protein
MLSLGHLSPLVVDGRHAFSALNCSPLVPKSRGLHIVTLTMRNALNRSPVDEGSVKAYS